MVSLSLSLSLSMDARPPRARAGRRRRWRRRKKVYSGVLVFLQAHDLYTEGDRLRKKAAEGVFLAKRRKLSNEPPGLARHVHIFGRAFSFLNSHVQRGV
jgi:hypothetical protein